ncbi:MAG: hypothetical protein ABSC21_23310 [Terriglobia bacterium]|jgi:hypothetical protein
MHKAGKRVKNNLTHISGNMKESGWTLAIERGRRLLVEKRQRAARLRAAIRTFEDNLANGMPWPKE